MKKIIIATILLLNLAFSNAVFMQKANKATFTVFSQLKEVENRSFGKKILDTIALQLQNKSPLGDIARMLAEIRQDLVAQQQQASQIHSAQEQECTEEISEYERRIAECIHNREEAENEISILKAEIASLHGEIANKGTQLSILDRREIELSQARERDAAAYEYRQRQSVEVVDALEIIIEKLSAIVPNTNDENLVMAELAKIGNSNPIMALVQVASTFSKESLDHVIQKMEELSRDLLESTEQDKLDEQAAIQEYNALMGELTKTRKDIQTAKSDAESRLTQAEGALSLQERILEESVACILENQENKVTKENVCEEWRTKWAEDKDQRAAEINVVKQVEAIIATKLDTMKDYLKDRANEGV